MAWKFAIESMGHYKDNLSAINSGDWKYPRQELFTWKVMISGLLKESGKYIKSYQINRFNQVLDLVFIDESILVARDYLFSDGSRKYSYHFQDKNKELIFRYDNAPHWRQIKTAPYHKHTKEGVFESSIMTLDKVVKKISKNFMKLD